MCVLKVGEIEGRSGRCGGHTGRGWIMSWPVHLIILVILIGFGIEHYLANLHLSRCLPLT